MLNELAEQAALTICGALLIALLERNVLPEEEINGILKDAADTHEFVPAGDQAGKHAAVVALINDMLERRIALQGW